MADFNVGRAKAAGYFMLGADIAYNVGSFSLSAPQTTERRIKDTEGASETPQEAMCWVWISTWKMLAYNGFATLLAGSIWPLLGGLVVIVDLHASYRYAIHRGTRSKTPGGRLAATVMGSQRGSRSNASDSSPLSTRP